MLDTASLAVQITLSPLLPGCDRHAYLVVFETAAAPTAVVLVEVLGFGAVDAAALLAVAAKMWKNMKMRQQE